MRTTPDVSEEMTLQMRTSSAADISVELTRHVSEITKVATTSSNLKGTYIKASKETAASFACGTSELVRRTGPAHSSTGATRLVEAKLSLLEEENTALRKELPRRAACVHECPQ
jgi:hypothetical protein